MFKKDEAFDVAEFAEGKIQFLGYRIDAQHPLCNLTLREIGELLAYLRQPDPPRARASNPRRRFESRMVPGVGLEPTTYGLKVRCSAN